MRFQVALRFTAETRSLLRRPKLLGICLLATLQAAGCAATSPANGVSGQPARVITEFRTIETPEAVAVIVKCDQPLTYTATLRNDPRGVSFQFPGAVLEGLPGAYFPPPNTVIRSIRTSQAGAGGEARAFLELAQDAPYAVASDPEGLNIVFRKPGAAAAFAGMPSISRTEAPAALPPRATSKMEPDAASVAAAAPATDASVLRNVSTEVVADAVLIRVTADGTIKTANVFTLENPARIVFDLMGLQSVFQGEQRIPVRSRWVSQVRHLGYLDKVRLVAETEARHLKSYHLEPTADGLVITVGVASP